MYIVIQDSDTRHSSRVTCNMVSPFQRGSYGNYKRDLDSFLGSRSPCPISAIACPEFYSVPGLLKLILSTIQFVLFSLRNIPDSGHILPEAMASSLRLFSPGPPSPRPRSPTTLSIFLALGDSIFGVISGYLHELHRYSSTLSPGCTNNSMMGPIPALSNSSQ